MTKAYVFPVQVEISGIIDAIDTACIRMKEAGAKCILPLTVSGAFNSPFMEPARQGLAEAIVKTEFKTPICPVYQNVDALPHTEPAEIKDNLLKQLTASVRWTQEVKNMTADGADEFVECGPGGLLTGIIKKIKKSLE